MEFNPNQYAALVEENERLSRENYNLRQGVDYYEEVLTLRKKVEKLEKYETIVQHASDLNLNFYFICGEGGDKDSMELPERIYVGDGVRS